MKKKIGAVKKSILALTVVTLIVGALVTLGSRYSSSTFNNIKENVVRLHIVANSDSKEDQDLKLKVRDKVVDFVGQMELDNSSAENYIDDLKNNTDIISAEVNKYLAELGKACPVSVTVGESVFPAKNYGDIVLPAGSYNSIKVTLGDGNGKNWWCVMFPPLCCTNSGTIAVSEQGKAALKETLSEEAYKTVMGNAASNVTLVADDGLVSDNVKVNVRFKIVEIFKSSGQKISGVFDNCARFFGIK